MDHINLKKHSTTSAAAAVKKSTVLPVAVVGNKMSKSSIHSIKRKKASKTGNNSNKATCVMPAVKAQLKPSKLQEPLAKSDLTKNLFTSFSMNQSLKSNPMLQGLSGNCDKTWPVPLFQIDGTKEPVATTFGSIAKGLHSLSSLASTTEAKDDKKNVSCNFCNTSNGSPCSACSTGNSNSSNSNTSSSNFFKTSHSTICIPQQSSVITSSPFRHLMVGPKISNMPTPFNGPINNNNNNSSPSSCQQTPVIDKNVNEENNCKILFHSGRGESHFVGPQTAEQPVGGAEPPVECVEPDMASKNNETLTPAVKTNSSTSKSSERKYTKAHLATMDPERLALIMQRKRDKKFRKLQSLSALMRAPDDRHSMGPLAALKRELTPNTLLGASSPNLSSNPFNRSSLTSRDHLNKLSVNNPWKGENSKKPCSFIHEPSLKNSAILSQNSLELPKRKLDYQKDINSPNSNLTLSDLWKMSTNREPVKENRSASTSSVIDDALRIAALKFIKNEVKDNESTPKDATPISAEIFGSHKIKTPNFFPPRPKEDSYTESGGSSSSGEENTKDKPTNNNGKKNTWSKENKSRNFSKPAIKSRKRILNSKRKPQMTANATSEQSRSLKRLPENNSNSSDNESSAKETEKSSPETKKSRISEGVKRKRLSVKNKRRGRPPVPNKLKNLKSVKRRGRPPVIGALKSKLQQRAVKCRNTFNKHKLVSTVSKVSKRRGRPPKNLDAPSKPEVPKLTDEDVMKVKLNIPRRRGRPSKAETMLREMAVAHLAATEKATPDAGKVNIGLGLTIRPRLTRKRSSASQPNLKRQRSLSQENVGSYGTKKIKTEPVSSEESTSDMTSPSYTNEVDKNIKEETNPDFSHHDSSTHTLSSAFEKGQRKKKSVKGGYRNDPDYINDKFVDDDEEDENGDVPANRSRPLLLRNVKKNSKPLPSYTDSSESDVEEPSEVAYKSPKQRVPIAKVKPTIKMCKPANAPPPPGRLMPPIYNVPRVLLPPSIKDTGIPCKMCAKVHTQDHFFKYMELKSTDQPHRCPLCGQYFTWSCLFIEHMRSHPENTAQYRCEYCYAVSRKISAYFNCRITHCPPSKEWLELQKTCDEYLAKVNEAKEKKHSRYTKVVTNRVIKTEGNNSSAPISKNINVGLNEAKDKAGKIPKVAPNNNNNKVVVAEGSRTTETKTNLSNEPKDKKNSRCMKSSSNKLVKNEAGNSTGEVKDVKEKLQMGPTNAKNSGRKNSNSKKPFLCEICQKTFLTFDFLTKHKQSHKSKRTFKCVECDKQFSNKAFFNVHNLTYHKHSKKSYTCEVCRVNFTYLNLYTNHVNLFGLLSQEEHIQRSLQALVCHICNRGFKLKQTFVNHVLTHTGERPFVCEVCNQAFTQMGSLDRHRRIHQKDKRSDKARRQDKTYVCKICQKVLSNELAYNNHMQTHEEDNRFFCDFCEQSFPNAHLLKTHKHNEQRPHKCKNCGRCYKLKQTLSEHKRVCGL